MKKNKAILIFSALLVILILIASIQGIKTPALYDDNTFYWQIQCVWQDLCNMTLIVPLLIIAGIGTYQNKIAFLPVWAGSLLYITYAYAIYCFSVHFNYLFLFYCLTFGLSVFGLLWFAYIRSHAYGMFMKLSRKPPALISIYLILIGVIFYVVWLTDIIPAMLQHRIPAQIIRLELMTNPVEVLDLSIILPMFILSGILMLQGRRPGGMLGSIMLVFAALMSITVGGLQGLMYYRNIDASWILSSVMILSALIDILLYIWMISLNDESLEKWNFG